MPSAPQLPQETLEHIIDNVSALRRVDLTACALTSRVLAQRARYQLFRRTILVIPAYPAFKYVDKIDHAACFLSHCESRRRTVALVPVVDLIEELSIIATPVSYGCTSTDGFLRVLSLLTNLRVLELHGLRGNGDIESHIATYIIHLPFLHTLIISSTAFALPRILHLFPNLRVLEVKKPF